MELPIPNWLKGGLVGLVLSLLDAAVTKTCTNTWTWTNWWNCMWTISKIKSENNRQKWAAANRALNARSRSSKFSICTSIKLLWFIEHLHLISDFALQAPNRYVQFNRDDQQ
ncbi:MAG: hypothetical protein IPJ53_17905 [Saprospiraceae bacterium]|nr:hypothetical protein [Candidatus Vicinibacter affinis]